VALDRSSASDTLHEPDASECQPNWSDTTTCSCTPTECQGCAGEKTQEDGCGDTRVVACSVDQTGCGGSCCGSHCCAAGESCDGSGLCCTPDTCASLGIECGTASDGCGGEVSCGGCGSNETCSEGTCEAETVDCSGIAQRAGFELCQSGSDSCAGVYTNGAGCTAYCAAAGMQPVSCFGGEPGCQKEAVTIDCYASNGHQSDWCECAGDGGTEPPPSGCTPGAGYSGQTLQRHFTEGSYSPRSSWVLDCRAYAYTAQFEEHEACDSHYQAGSGHGTATFNFSVARGPYQVYLVGRHTTNRNSAGAVVLVRNGSLSASGTVMQRDDGGIEADLVGEYCLEGAVEVVVDSSRNSGSDSVESIRLVPTPRNLIRPSVSDPGVPQVGKLRASPRSPGRRCAMRLGRPVSLCLSTLLGLAGFASSAPARADSLRSTRGQPVVELSHAVDVDIADGLATLRVRRSFENRGALEEQIEMEIELPPGAAATGLRIKGKKRWYEGLLMEAQMADVVYESLTGFGPWRVKDPALLFWDDLGALRLMLFPVLPGVVSTIEYTLLVPLTYRDGRYAFAYPARVHQAELAVPSIAARNRGLRLEVNGEQLDARERRPLARRMLAGEEYPPDDLEGGVELVAADEIWDDTELEEQSTWGLGQALAGGETLDEVGLSLVTAPAPAIDVVATRYATFQLAPDKLLYALELDAAAELQPAPRRASVVFVVDASRSFDRAGIDASLDLCRAYADHLPDARVEVVLFRREATRLLDQFVPGDRIDAALELAATGDALEPGNGSALDAGLALAAELLERRRGPRRIVAIGDGRMRERFRNSLAADALSAVAEQAVVHLVELSPVAADDEVVLTRDDEDALAPIALAHGGMLVALETGNRVPDYGQAALELVRPLRIHDFNVSAGDRPFGEVDVVEELWEGEGHRFMAISDEAPPFVALQGRIWAEPFIRIVAADPERGGELLPALLFGSDLYFGLERGEMMRAAAAGKAVSPVTSYLSVEPGTRPSTAGFEEEGGLGVAGFGSGGGGFSIGCGGALGIGAGDPTDYAELIEELAAAGAAACRAAGGPSDPVPLQIDCTLDEIVDVEVEPSDNAALDHCLEEAVWAVQLPSLFKHERMGLQISL